MPAELEAQCTICGADSETDQHMLNSCPSKLRIWQEALSKYSFGDLTWTLDTIEALLYSRAPTITTREDIPATALLAVILFSIWKYHFNFIRDEEPFDVGRVLAAIDIAIGRILAQLAHKKEQERLGALLTHSPPVPNLDDNFPT